MNTNDAGVKIQMIERSLRCFTFGVIALLPFIGAPFAVLALTLSARVRAMQRNFWNPARNYQRWGFASSAAGIAITLMIKAWIAVKAAFPDTFGDRRRVDCGSFG